MKGAGMPKQWELRNADAPVGVLTLAVIDQPWFRCEFIPGENWEQVRHLFEAQAVSVDSGNENEMMEAISAVRKLSLSLHPVHDGEVIIPVMIQIRSNKANFRY
ncbi:hypothetical protein ACWD4F_31775 [Streptomyces aureus]